MPTQTGERKAILEKMVSRSWTEFVHLVVLSPLRGIVQDGESRLDVSLVGGVARYRVLGCDGVSLDGASDWDGLVARLKPAFPGDGEGVSIFLP